MSAANIHVFFDKKTSTFSYLISDPETLDAVIIDPVLDYDQYSGTISTDFADKIISYIKDNHLNLLWILETHIHADHLTSAAYIKEKIGGRVGISEKIKDVLAFWVPFFSIEKDTPIDGRQFDELLKNDQVIKCGNLDIKIINTPGHTPACISYIIDDAIFCGDTLFMPDIGTARTDFPGGNAEMLYDSIMKILSLGNKKRIFTGHDYPENTRIEKCQSTVEEQKKYNIMINARLSKKDYIKTRNDKDYKKNVPKNILPAIQFNLRAGSFGEKDKNGRAYFKIPINAL